MDTPPQRLPTLDDLRQAAARIAGQAVETPLLSCPFLDELAGGRVFLKCENLQRTGSFKFRGAFNAIAALGPAARSGGIVAMSSGNHAQGVAEAARLFDVPATIVMPTDAPAIKKARTLRSGARIVEYDRLNEDRSAVGKRLLAETGGSFIHPFDDFDIVAGQGTVGLEIASGLKALDVVPDAVLVPASGGGLSSGVGVAMKAAYPDVELVLIEPAGFDDYARSLEADGIVSNERTAGSICDGLLSPAPGQIGFALNRANHARALAVTDAEVLAAVAFAFRELKVVVEPSGAVALAALLSGHFDVAGRTVALVLSGGNIDASMLERALDAA